MLKHQKITNKLSASPMLKQLPFDYENCKNRIGKWEKCRLRGGWKTEFCDIPKKINLKVIVGGPFKKNQLVKTSAYVEIKSDVKLSLLDTSRISLNGVRLPLKKGRTLHYYLFTYNYYVFNYSVKRNSRSLDELFSSERSNE